MRRLGSAFVILVCLGFGLSLMPAVAAAQSFTGGLRGAVKDANGLIPGAKVL